MYKSEVGTSVAKRGERDGQNVAKKNGTEVRCR